MEKKRNINELKIGSIITYINLIISTIIPLLYTPIMLRILGQKEYGLYSLSNSVISYLTLLNFGFGTAIIRFISKFRVEGNHEKIEGITGLILFIYGIIAVVVCILGFLLTKGTGLFFGVGLNSSEIQRLKILMIIMTVSTAISFPVSVLSSVSVAYEKYIFRKMVDMVATIAAPILNLIVLVMGYASIGLAMIGLMTQVVYGIIFIWYCKQKLNVVPCFKNMPLNMTKEILGFSVYIFASSIIDMLYWATDKVLIGAVLGTVAVAVYNIGGTFTAMLQNMSSAISGVFGTRVNMMVFEKQPIEKLSELLIRIGRLQYYVVSLILSGYIVFGQIFIDVWAGKDYSQAYIVGLLTMIPLAVPLIQNIAFTVISAQNRLKFRTIVYASIAILNVIGTMLAMPKFGIIGAAVCTAIAFTIGNGILMNGYYLKVIKLDIISFWKNIIRISIVPIGLAIIFKVLLKVVIIKNLWIMFTFTCIYVILFSIGSWVLEMNNYEKSLLKGMIRKMSIVRTKGEI